MSSCGLADLRLRIVARPTRAPRVERSPDSPPHLPIRPRLILPHPWFCRYEHSCATASTTKGAVKRNGTRLERTATPREAQSSATAHVERNGTRHERAATPREAQSSATAHGMRGRRRRGRRAVERNGTCVASECGDAEGGAGETWASHGTWHVRASGEGGLQRAARAHATAHCTDTGHGGTWADCGAKMKGHTGEGVGAWTMEGNGLRYDVCKV
jgi:hypothetical protein